MKKVINKETSVTKTKPAAAPKKTTAVKAAPKETKTVKTYSLVIEGLTKTQAEALQKFFQKGAQCKIV